MRKLILVTVLASLLTVTSFAQISIGTSTPDSSAQFEIYSNTKGFLPPRISLTATNIALPVVKPAIGLLVYNTATSGGITDNVSPGYYFWDGKAWCSIVIKGSSSGDMIYWNGTRWTTIPVGANGSVLTLFEGVPTWGTKEQILVSKTWKVDRLHHMIGGSYSSYTNGGANNTGINYDNLRFTFNSNGTGTHIDQYGTSYSTAWQFTSSDKRTLIFTVNASTPSINTWIMVELAGAYLHASTNLTISGNSNNMETFRLVQIQN